MAHIVVTAGESLRLSVHAESLGRLVVYRRIASSNRHSERSGIKARGQTGTKLKDCMFSSKCIPTEPIGDPPFRDVAGAILLLPRTSHGRGV